MFTHTVGMYSPGLEIEDMIGSVEEDNVHLQGIGGVGHEKTRFADRTIANDNTFDISIDTHCIRTRRRG